MAYHDHHLIISSSNTIYKHIKAIMLSEPHGAWNNTSLAGSVKTNIADVFTKFNSPSTT